MTKGDKLGEEETCSDERMNLATDLRRKTPLG